MKTRLTLLICLLSVVGSPAPAAERPYLRSEQEISMLRAGRASQAREQALQKWVRYVMMSDEETWALLPGPKVYRAMGVNRTEGCPKCGVKAYQVGGSWPFECDMWRAPWKVACPSCEEVFPKNDFAAFYDSGLGPDGLFEPDRADRKLLFHVEHPKPNDPLHAHGVDDGTGWLDEQGNRFWFVARYCGYLWVQVTRDARAMADDYQRTGARELAGKAAIILARMADFYPDMDFSTQGVHPGNYELGGDRGKAIWACGPISEAVRMRQMLATYDDIWEIFDEDPGLVEFLTKKAGRIGHPEWAGAAGAIRKHVEEHLIAEGARDVIRDRARGSTRYGGDVGHMAWTIALQGLVVDDETLKQELLAWPFEGPYPLRGGMHEVLCGPILGREGAGGSSAPGYSSTHYKMARTLADIYARLDPPHHRDLYAAYSCIQKSYDSQFSLNCCERYYPHIGDNSNCGSPGLVCDANTMLDAFEKFGEPRYARMAYFLNRHSTDGFAEDVADSVQSIVDQHGDWRPASTNLNGYGLAFLRSGELQRDQRAAWMYYGCAVTNSHTHYDRLNIGLFAKGLDLLPDLGYPERTGAWPKRGVWTNNTISHNTVVVDRQRQKRASVGNMQVFCRTPIVKLIEVAREAVYPQTDVYRRSFAMVNISECDCYLVDIFRVKGGREHHYSFHSAEGTVESQSLNLVTQRTGTLAGPDIPFGQFDPDSQGWDYNGIGFQYLRDVQRDVSPPSQWSVTWRAQDTWNVFGKGKRADTNVRLRLTMLGNHNEVILATGEPPRLGKPENPETLKYLLVQDRGDELASLYASVIEPFEGKSNLASIRRLPVTPAADAVDAMEAMAMEIRHASGAVDIVLSAHDGSIVRRTGGFEYSAGWAFVRMREGRVVDALLAEGAKLAGHGLRIELPAACMSGVIRDFDREMDSHNCIYTDTRLPAGDALAGSWMKVANDGAQDACYEIKKVWRENGRTVIDLGDVTLIRGVRDPNDYDAGHNYNFAAGQSFTIPAWAWGRACEKGRYETKSNFGDAGAVEISLDP